MVDCVDKYTIAVDGYISISGNYTADGVEQETMAKLLS